MRFVDGTYLFLRQAGQGRPLVCFHGFPTSSYDWHRLLPLLADEHHIICFDFPGYGLSAKPADREYTIARQADAAEALIADLGIQSFDLLAHDMGATVACELIDRVNRRASRLRPKSVTLLNAGLYMDLHRPLLTQRLLRTPYINQLVARLSSRWLFMHQYPKVYARPDEFDRDHYEAQWTLLINQQGRQVLHLLAGYMRERLEHSDRWLGALAQAGIPLRLIWGMADPIAVPAIAERLQQRLPVADAMLLQGIGHYPQLEDAAQVYASLSRWLGDSD